MFKPRMKELAWEAPRLTSDLCMPRATRHSRTLPQAHTLRHRPEIPSSELVHQGKESKDAELLQLIIPLTSNIYKCLKQQSRYFKPETTCHVSHPRGRPMASCSVTWDLSYPQVPTGTGPLRQLQLQLSL